MHYQNLDHAISTGDPATLTEVPNAGCVKGCYRCLLSYYNQPDHEHIDRTDPEVLEILLRLARADVAPLEKKRREADTESPDLADEWRLPEPDINPLVLDGVEFPLVWRSHLVVAPSKPTGSEQLAALEALGFSVIVFDPAISDAPPAELRRLLGGPPE
jgi:hypothetical protein